MTSRELGDSVGWGFTTGGGASLVGVVLWLFSECENSPATAMAWLLPMTFVIGLVLATQPRSRRFGTGLLLGSLAVALAVLIFFMWLAATIGS